MKRIILCADDYGQNAAISQAIIDLFKDRRLSATSCLTNSYYWTVQSKWLDPFKEQVDIGLHFNLTQGKPLTPQLGPEFKTLSELILDAYLRRLDKEMIETELNAQIDQFVEGIGQLPQFIDGHQHIQQLPIIRDALFHVYEKRLKDSGCYIRAVNDNQAIFKLNDSAYLKMLIIQLCGAFTFKKGLTKKNIPHNASFAGVYNFNKAPQFSTIFPGFLQRITDRGLIMCHPGLPATSEEDPIAAARPFEYEFLKSDLFLKIYQKENINLVRFHDAT